tara:strand:+ start:106 stop:786 length:681 start_codon:yes stop_codon:yes gene_type:complete
MSQTKVQLVNPVDGSIVAADLADDAITAAKLADSAITTAKLADDAVSLAKLSASGTPSSSNFLRGDNSFQPATVDTIAFFGQQNSANSTSVATGTWTPITYLGTNGISQNTGSSWDSDAGRFTVASGQAGLYVCFGQAGIDDLQRVDVVYGSVAKNNATPVYYVAERSIYSGGSTPNVVTGTSAYVSIENLAVGDYVEFKVYHNEGSTEPTEYQQTMFGGYRIVAT